MYEYKTFLCHPNEVETKLNHLAVHGWRMVKLIETIKRDHLNDNSCYDGVIEQILVVMEREKNAKTV